MDWRDRSIMRTSFPQKLVRMEFLYAIKEAEPFDERKSLAV
jgi:hypothetical protein